MLRDKDGDEERMLRWERRRRAMGSWRASLHRAVLRLWLSMEKEHECYKAYGERDTAGHMQSSGHAPCDS